MIFGEEKLRRHCHQVSSYEGAGRNGYLAPGILFSALDGGQWSLFRRDHFIPWETSPRNSLNWRLEGASERCGENKNIVPLTGIELSFLRCTARSSCITPTEQLR
jgi:hypothetical protein